MNYEVFRRAEETKSFLWQLENRAQLISHILQHNGLKKRIIEGIIEGINHKGSLT